MANWGFDYDSIEGPGNYYVVELPNGTNRPHEHVPGSGT